MAIEGRGDAVRGGKIRLGMVGGGEGAFIGAVHRLAARMDGHYDFVAGALSSTPEKAQRSGAALGLAPDRIYAHYEAMAKAEAARPDGVEAVAIVTPNHAHLGPTLAFLKAGIHVICDKPLALSLAEGRQMQAAVEASGRIFALTHNYTGYPLVRRAREMVKAGELGEIRLVQVEYPQDWLTGPTEKSGNKQAEWRTDPARSGAGGRGISRHRRRREGTRLRRGGGEILAGQRRLGQALAQSRGSGPKRGPRRASASAAENRVANSAFWSGPRQRATSHCRPRLWIDKRCGP